jgi:hypothetical protein
MRTRRSPRNQDILWRALGDPAPTKGDSTSVESLESQLAMAKANFLGQRTYRQIEREIARAKMRKALKDTG